MNNKLEHVYRQIPNASCPDNCGKCCGILHPSMAEIRNVQEWLSQHNKPFIDFNMTVGDNCPYLGGDKKCTIYPVRPFLCRIMGVSSDLPCPHGCKPDKVLNHAQSNWCYHQIYLRGKEKPRTEKHRKYIHNVLIEQGLLERRF